ncbi:FG-GAP-like repeat-containing protein, partial [Planctomycetota bacterium]
METIKTYQIVEGVLLFLLISGCRNALPDSINAQKSTTESTVSVLKKQPVAMDTICDLSLFGENLGDDAHTTNTGDIDGDGYTDLIIGASFSNSRDGRAYLYYGGPNGLSISPDLIFEGEPGQGSRLGWSIGMGDVDNDGYNDIILSGFDYDNSRGRAYLYWGASRETIDAKADLVFEGENATDRFSFSWDDMIVEDIDADGYADIVIPAATYGPSEGRVYLYWGNTKTGMDTKADLIFPHSSNGWFGLGLDCGDIDQDGYKDIVI